MFYVGVYPAAFAASFPCAARAEARMGHMNGKKGFGKMKTVKRTLALLLALAMILALCACGDKEPKDPNLYKFGDYEVYYKGARIMNSENGEDALVMTFDFTNNSKEAASYGWTIYEKPIQNGVELESVYVITNPDTYEGVTNNYFIQVAPGETLEVGTSFKLNGMDKVEMNLSDLWDKYTYTITVDPATLPREDNATSNWGADDWDLDVTTEPSTELAEPSFTDWWEGDWYGWWLVSDCTGDYESIDGMWWDVCGTIDVQSDLTGTLELWDEDGNRNELICLADVSFLEDGTMVSESGEFMDVILAHADWLIDPGVELYDDTIVLDGFYDGVEGEYSYMVFLRPWGTLWDDMEEDMLPAYYDWYYGLVLSGTAMPDFIGGGPADISVPGGNDTPDVPVSSGSLGSYDGAMSEHSVQTLTYDSSAETMLHFKLPDENWCIDDFLPNNIQLFNSNDPYDVYDDTTYLRIQVFDTEERLARDDGYFVDLVQTDGYTVGGVALQGRTYTLFDDANIQEYYGQLPNGVWISIRMLYMTDATRPVCYAILDSLSFG